MSLEWAAGCPHRFFIRIRKIVLLDFGHGTHCDIIKLRRFGRRILLSSPGKEFGKDRKTICKT